MTVEIFFFWHDEGIIDQINNTEYTWCINLNAEKDIYIDISSRFKTAWVVKNQNRKRKRDQRESRIWENFEKFKSYHSI